MRAPHLPAARRVLDRQIHAVLSSAYSAAVLWGWLAFNPMDAAQTPRPPAPDPDPPTSEEAVRIVATARAEDPGVGHARLDLPGHRRPPR